MTNYVSFSLYGSDPKYLEGALRNAEAAPRLFGSWISVFYVGNTVPADYINRLSELGSRVVRVTDKEDASSMLWRYRAVFFDDAELVIFRDTDSRLSRREALLVEEWIKSGRDLHIIRDHPNHTSAILGGLWGCNAAAIRTKLKEALEKNPSESPGYGFDQEVIRGAVFRNPTLSRLVHDSIFVREIGALSPQRHDEDGSFLGEVFSANDLPDPEGRATIKKYWSSKRFRLLTQLKSFKTISLDLCLDIVRTAKRLLRID